MGDWGQICPALLEEGWRAVKGDPGVSIEEILKAARVTIPFEPFRTAEFLGLGHGGVYQGNVKIPAGTHPCAEWVIPEKQVWYRVNVIFSVRTVDQTSILGSALRYTFYADGKKNPNEENVLLTYGWLEKILCPPGWFRSEKSQAWSFENVTGNSDYNVLPAQTVWLQCTCYIFVVFKPYVTNFERLAKDLLFRLKVPT